MDPDQYYAHCARLNACVRSAVAEHLKDTLPDKRIVSGDLRILYPSTRTADMEVPPSQIAVCMIRCMITVGHERFVLSETGPSFWKIEQVQDVFAAIRTPAPRSERNESYRRMVDVIRREWESQASRCAWYASPPDWCHARVPGYGCVRSEYNLKTRPVWSGSRCEWDTAAIEAEISNWAERRGADLAQQVGEALRVCRTATRAATENTQQSRIAEPLRPRR